MFATMKEKERRRKRDYESRFKITKDFRKSDDLSHSLLGIPIEYFQAMLNRR